MALLFEPDDLDLRFDRNGEVQLAPGFRHLQRQIMRRLRRLQIEAAIARRRTWTRGLSLWLRRYSKLDISRQAIASAPAEQLIEMLRILSSSAHLEMPRA